MGIGGNTVRVHFVDATLRLHPGADDDEYIEWQTEIGVVERWRPTWPAILGQVGFLDQFTVTMHRQSQRFAVEQWDAFDGRFGQDYLRQ